MASINDLVSRIKTRLSRRSSVEDATILAELIAAQERLEDQIHLPDFLKIEETKIVTTGTLDLTTLTNKFIRFNEDVDRAVYYVDNSLDEPEVPIKRYDDRGQLRQIYPGNLTAGGFPSGYAYSYPDLELRPRPTADVPITLKIRMFRQDPTIPAVDATTLWSAQAPELLMSEAGLPLAKLFRDPDSMQYFQQTLSQAKAKLFGVDIATSVADTELVMGD